MLQRAHPKFSANTDTPCSFHPWQTAKPLPRLTLQMSVCECCWDNAAQLHHCPIKKPTKKQNQPTSTAFSIHWWSSSYVSRTEVLYWLFQKGTDLMGSIWGLWELWFHNGVSATDMLFRCFLFKKGIHHLQNGRCEHFQAEQAELTVSAPCNTTANNLPFPPITEKTFWLLLFFPIKVHWISILNMLNVN